MSHYRIAKPLVLVLIVGGILLAGSWSIHQSVQRDHQRNLASTLQGVLNTAHQALINWHAGELQYVRLWAESDEVREAAQDLLQLPRTNLDLLGAPGQQRMREWFARVSRASHYEGFMLIAPDDTSLASNFDTTVGIFAPLVRQPEVLRRARRGETVISLPQLSVVPLPDGQGQVRSHRATMFVVSPVHDEQQQIVALLALRIDPSRGLSSVLAQGRLGGSGETYAFNRRGIMLSQSRFDGQLRDIGLLAADELSPLQVWLRDPGVNLVAAEQPTLPRYRQPLTHMAESAVHGIDGLDIHGYRDYRGVEVVGAWLWDDQLGVGLATEQDRAEAYASLRTMRLALVSLSGLGMLSIVGLAGFFVYSQQRQADREHHFASDLRVREERLRLALENTGQGLWEMNFDARPDYFSDQMFHQFGHRRDAHRPGFDQFVELLHPQDRGPALAHFADVLENNGREDFRAEVRIGTADGDWRQVLWRGRCVERDEFGRAARMLGVVSDVTERRRMEAALRDSEQRFAQLAKAAPDAIIMLDDRGVISYWNPAATRIFGYTEEQVLGRDLHQLLAPESLRVQAMQSYPAFATSGDGPIVATDRPRELQALRRDGKIFPVELSVSSVLLDGRWHAVGVLRDVTERRRLENDLVERERRAETLALVARHTDNAVVITERSGRIEWVNEGFERITGYSLDEVAGRRPGDFLQGPETDPQTVAFMAAQLEHGKGFQVEVINYSKQGLPYWLHIVVTPIHDRYGRLQRFIAIESDVSERKRLEADLLRQQQELSHANQELRRAARMKDEFLATMSHELRTPLNSVLALSEVLMEGAYGEINERQHRYLGSIRSSGQHLLELINDILDVSKIESGKLQLAVADVEVEGLCQAALAIVREMAANKRLHVDYRRDPAISHLRGDNRRLKQLLVNLLSNAVKFTPEGRRIGLAVDLTEDQAVFEVWDQGIGIPEDQQRHVFEPFVQVDSSLTRGAEGTGLGLALVQRLAQLHDGAVTLLSEPGSGSRFLVHLPWDREWQTQQLQSAEPPLFGDEPPLFADESPARSASRRVLLVDDNAANIEVLRDYLELKGYRVDTANSGRQALQAAAENPPAAIVMDVQMPGMDGLEATRRLRADPRTRNIPVVAATALAMPGDRERCLEAGADRYIAKPLSPRKVVGLLDELLS